MKSFRPAIAFITAFVAALLLISPVFAATHLMENLGRGVIAVRTSSTTTFVSWRVLGAAISGATNSSYTIASPATSDAGSYTVVATNSAGSVTSNVAVLTVIVAPGNAIISFTVE